MNLTVEIPDDVASRLTAAGGDLSRRALEALVADEYRHGRLNKPDLRRLLGFQTSDQIDTFLRDHEVWIDYSMEDLEPECAGLQRLGAVATTMDWSHCPAVESVPGKVSGAWVLKDTRMPVSAIFENLEAGASIDDILEWFHGLDKGQVQEVIEFAARSLDKPPTYAA